MKTPQLDANALLSNPMLFSALSADQQNWLKSGKAYGRIKIYTFAKNVYAGSGIIKLSDETQSKAIGITNIEKSKFDSDSILLGVGLQVAKDTAEITNVKAADFSNLLRTPAGVKQDSDDASAQSIYSLRGANSLRVDAAIRNGELRYVVGGNELFRVQAEDFFVDADQNTGGVNGDFAQYYSLLNSPRLITQDKEVAPVLEVPAAIALYNAVRIKHYVLEVAQI